MGRGAGAGDVLHVFWWPKILAATIGIDSMMTALMMGAVCGTEGRDDHASAHMLHQSGAGYGHEEAL